MQQRINIRPNNVVAMLSFLFMLEIFQACLMIHIAYTVHYPALYAAHSSTLVKLFIREAPEMKQRINVIPYTAIIAITF